MIVKFFSNNSDSLVNCIGKRYLLNVYLNKNNIGSYVYTDKSAALKTFIADFNNSIPINQYIEYDTALSSDEISSLVSEMGCE